MGLHFAKIQILQNDNPGKRRDISNIAFHAGEIFQKAILLCLYAADDTRGDVDKGSGTSNDEDTGRDDAGHGDINVQKEVVDLLRQASFSLPSVVPGQYRRDPVHI